MPTIAKGRAIAHVAHNQAVVVVVLLQYLVLARLLLGIANAKHRSFRRCHNLGNIRLGQQRHNIEPIVAKEAP